MKNKILELYKEITSWAVTILITLMIIFGGKISITINWNSWVELINHFKN